MSQYHKVSIYLYACMLMVEKCQTVWQIFLIRNKVYSDSYIIQAAQISSHWKALSHKFTLFHGVSEDGDRRLVSLVRESFFNGGELFFHLQREMCFPETKTKFCVAKIASAIGYLCGLNIIHRPALVSVGVGEKGQILSIWENRSFICRGRCISLSQGLN